LLFLGFRGFIFTDWESYYAFFQKCPGVFDSVKEISAFFSRGQYFAWGRGFLVYTFIIKSFTQNYFLFQFISFSIDIFILYWFFKKYIPNYIVLGFLFFYSFNGIDIEVNLLRNSKAILLFLISIKYIEKHNFIKYLMINILGCLFHISSIVYIPLYFILNRTFNKYFILFIFIAGNIIFLLQIKWFSSVLIKLAAFNHNRLFDLIINYMNSEKFSSPYGISIGYLERQITFIIFYMNVDKLRNDMKVNNIFLNAFFVYCFIYLYFAEMYILVMRIPLLLVFSYWILYPKIYSYQKKNSKYLFLFMLLSYTTLRLISGYSSVMCLYDNALFGYKSYEVRKTILHKALGI
jgi:hypothetical protein